MEVGYSGSFDYDKYLEIEDIGKVAIKATDLYDQVYYLVISTDSGKTSIFEYGPVVEDMSDIPSEVVSLYNRMTYNKGKIWARVSKFLGVKKPKEKNKKNFIIDARIIHDPREIYEKVTPVKDIMCAYKFKKPSVKEMEDIILDE